MDILFTHDDLDGAGCSVVFELAHHGLKEGVDFEIINCSNANINTKVSERMETIGLDDFVTIADICCEPELLRKLDSLVDGTLIVADHHATNTFAKDIIGDRAMIIPADDNGTLLCGTSILAEYYKQIFEDTNDSRVCMFDRLYAEFSLLDEFIQDVQEYDTFVFKQTGNMNAKYLQVLFSMIGMKRFRRMYVDRICDGTKCLFDDNSLAFIEAKIESEQSFIDNYPSESITRFEWNGYRCGLVFNMFANFSEFANQYLTKHTDIDILIMVSFGKDTVFQFRCIRDDINLGTELAQPLGGGGHPKAAGAPISEGLICSIKLSILGEIAKQTNAPIITSKQK